MNTPEIVQKAILNEGKTKLTIRRYTLLERLQSPFLDTTKELNIENVVPSLFVMAKSSEELKKYGYSDIEQLKSDALDWSDGLDLDQVPALIEKTLQDLYDVNAATPDVVPEKKTKVKKQA